MLHRILILPKLKYGEYDERSKLERYSLLSQVPEWGGTIYVGVMTLEERLCFDEAHRDSTGKMKDISNPKVVYDLLKCCLRDQDGKALFDDSSINSLQSKSSKVVNALFTKAIEINYLDSNSVDELKKK